MPLFERAYVYVCVNMFVGAFDCMLLFAYAYVCVLLLVCAFVWAPVWTGHLPFTLLAPQLASVLRAPVLWAPLCFWPLCVLSLCVLSARVF